MISMTDEDMEIIESLLDLLPVQIRVRFSIFITISVCAGLPALVWSARYIIQHRRNGHRISAFTILLLLTDCTELLLSPYIMIKNRLHTHCWSVDWTCWVVGIVWVFSRVCGFPLNQLVALEGNLSVKYPLYTARVFSSKCFITFYIILFFCIIITLFLNPFLFVLLLYIMPVIVWILSCFAPCCSNRHSHTSRKPDPHIWVIFIFAVLVLYLPWILAISFILFPPTADLFLEIYLIPFFLINLRLISDPLLCVLVYRQNLSVQTAQNPTGLV